METTDDENMIDISYAMWTVWKARNARVFNGRDIPTTEMEACWNSERRKWRSCQQVRNPLSSRPILPQQTNTQTPMIYPRKIVCDGAFKDNIRKGAYGVVMTDAEGRILDGRARSFFCRSPLGAEAEALLAAVELAGDNNCGTVILTDSQILYTSLYNPQDQWPWEIAATLARIHYALARTHNTTIMKADRSEVQQADHIARLMRDDVLPTNWLSAL
ncbi:hypothetical protein LINPERPRIM_LOCUS29110 [Linum perenne]